MPGPVPKRSEQRRRRNKPTGATLSKGSTGAKVKWPAAGRGWHPLAADWYRSLKVSGQAEYYEQSDVATARVVAEAMSKCLQADRISGQLFTAVMSAQADLLTTEAARRRARVELERIKVDDRKEDPKVTAMAAYRKAAAGE